jgi:hypothetical protein
MLTAQDSPTSDTDSDSTSSFPPPSFKRLLFSTGTDTSDTESSSSGYGLPLPITDDTDGLLMILSAAEDAEKNLKRKSMVHPSYQSCKKVLLPHLYLPLGPYRM